MGEDRLGGGAAAGERGVVQGQRPGLVGGRRVQGGVLLVLLRLVAQASISPCPAAQWSWRACRKSEGPRGFFWVGPHQWPEPSSRERGRVKVT